MINTLARTKIMHRSRGALLLRGILAIIFGLVVLSVPGIVLIGLIIVFGAFAFIEGILAIVVAIQERRALSHWGWLLLEGIAGIVLGITAFVWPLETALILLFIVAIWAMITGVMEVAAAITARSWLLGLAGILSVAFGILLFTHPGTGLLSILWLLGIYSLLFGFMLILHAFVVRSRLRHPAMQAR